MSPNQDVLFPITVESINEKLQLQPRQNLTPISIGDLQDQFSELNTTRIVEIRENFKNPP